jgi:hypothetical protein
VEHISPDDAREKYGDLRQHEECCGDRGESEERRICPRNPTGPAGPRPLPYDVGFYLLCVTMNGRNAPEFFKLSPASSPNFAFNQRAQVLLGLSKRGDRRR